MNTSGKNCTLLILSIGDSPRVTISHKYISKHNNKNKTSKTKLLNSCIFPPGSCDN